MQITFLHGYPDYIGKRFAYVGYGSGPASYVTGGDPITLPRYDNYIDLPYVAVSQSGTYWLVPIPSAVGARAAWKYKWVVIATGLQVAAATNLYAESAQVGGTGGVY
jgi:hypothetical protein